MHILNAKWEGPVCQFSRVISEATHCRCRAHLTVVHIVPMQQILCVNSHWTFFSTGLFVEQNDIDITCRSYCLNNSYMGPPLRSSGQSFWLQIQGSWVRFPALPDFLRSNGSGTGSTQPREDN
jgi:hypothetical protein